MMCLLNKMNLDKYPPRSYIIAATDAMSEKKALFAEQQRPGTSKQVLGIEASFELCFRPEQHSTVVSCISGALKGALFWAYF